MRNARTERDEISQLGQMRSEPNKLGSTDMTGTVDLVQAAASTATALGIFAAGWQLYLTKRQAVTQFEDQLTSQYRDRKAAPASRPIRRGARRFCVRGRTTGILSIF